MPILKGEHLCMFPNNCEQSYHFVTPAKYCIHKEMLTNYYSARYEMAATYKVDFELFGEIMVATKYIAAEVFLLWSYLLLL